MPRFDLPGNLRGQTLRHVVELSSLTSEDTSRFVREAVVLILSSSAVSVCALSETSTLAVVLGDISSEPTWKTSRRLAGSDPIERSIGRQLHTWWTGLNDVDQPDFFALAFSATDGVGFVAMNNEVALISLSGEQFA
jgi:hypothetical protein